MLDWLGLSAVNPALLWGGLAIASPIIIHLLSKRKFKVVDWAAMDFLFDADRRNRRRVRLENLLLLLLRCLAILLIALLVARPFLKPTGLAAQAMQAVSLERIVLLDDSPSMQVRSGKGTVFEDAKQGLVEFVRELSAGRSGDTLTLILTSRPESPLVNGQYMGADKAEEIVRTLEELKPSDVAAQLDKALLAVEDALTSPTGNPNRVVYVLSDLRKRDWIAGRDAARDRSAPAILRRLSNKADGCILVDLANESSENLLIADIAPLDKTLVAGVESRFEVSVLNAGDKDADDVQVKLSPGDALELSAKIDRIRPGERASAPFTFLFRDSGAVGVRAEIANPDVLPADSTRQFAARVSDGVQVLIVDGDPSSEFGRSESFFLAKALAPPGGVSSGNVVEVVTDNQFESLALQKYQVIYLLNMYRVSDERIAALESWVKAGGGLVVALGDQVDEESYNQRLYKEGQGLLPVKLEGIRGDEREQQWVNFAITAANHPVLSIFEGAQNPLIKSVPIFRWWGVTVPAAEVAAGHTSIPAHFSDPEGSPACVERAFGDGRVTVLTSPLDGDWSNWPAESSGSYVIVSLETTRYMARKSSGEGNLIVGMPIRQEIDPAQYKLDARLTAPGREPAVLQAVSAGDAPREGESSDSAKGLFLQYDDTLRAGLYNLELTRRDGQTESLLFAANIDPTEGELKRVDESELRRLLGDARVQLARGKVSLSIGATGSRAEVWEALLIGLAVVLCTEQCLAWAFGRRRQ